ncbi:UvrD-helicase domain-containing protein [Ancylobacter polymorphus]|uniref:AAA family ATPase n=1 Tax=Ancylobacter polymorphus TaxID=223390 RepID=A0A9E7CX33_9HYPH|nr:UvrD-helicase domain-containing protein [Ancylobacter polymorphus]UOK71859.1 AAA family ATPase [Ancylobacter polymorphus]
MQSLTANNLNLDDHVDGEIAACLTLEQPRSFFLYAGAGSGKTRSLVNALEHIREKHGPRLNLRGQRVAVVTYTNVASDEITRRLRFDRLFNVRTIHSFAWTLIEGFNSDIRDWIAKNLNEEIAELKADEEKGRKGTKASENRLARIESVDFH